MPERPCGAAQLLPPPTPPPLGAPGLRSLPLRSLPSTAILKWCLLQPSLVALFIYFAPTGLLHTHSRLV